MNILFITNHLNIGGITSYLITLAAGLRKRGHKVYIASSGGKMLTSLIQGGINFISIPIKTKQEVSFKILISFFKLKKAIRENNIEIIHSNSRTTQVVGWLLERFCHMTHISTCHGFFKRRISRRLFPCWGQMTIAISEQVKEHLIKDFNVKSENIAIVHNGIDVDRFRVQTCPERSRGGKDYRLQKKEDFGLGNGPVIGIVARLADVKGHIYLIKAMKAVLKKIPLAQLLIIGDGKMRLKLINLSRALTIDGNVKFISSLPDIRGILSIMDVFVMPSLKEGLGLSIMEAMACGLPVVASDVGGITSLIKNEINGLLVEPYNVEELSQAILQLLQNRALAKSLGNQARDYIARNFSQERMIIETEKLYSECLNTKT